MAPQPYLSRTDRRVAKVKPIGDFQFLFLRSVLKLGKNAFGSAIQERIEKILNVRVNPGQIYTTADKLIADGYLESRPNSIQDNGRTATLYVCLPDGARAAEEKARLYKKMLD